jgi:hypothetical protein
VAAAGAAGPAVAGAAVAGIGAADGHPSDDGDQEAPETPRSSQAVLRSRPLVDLVDL